MESDENEDLVKDKQEFYEAEGELLTAAFYSYWAIRGYYDSASSVGYNTAKLQQYADMIAIGIGIGFTFALTLLGLVREILGSGSAFGYKFITGDGILVFVLAPGAFMALAYLIVLFKKVTAKKGE